MSRGFFASERASHPYRVGDFVDDKKVTSTYYAGGAKGNVFGEPWITLNHREKVAVSSLNSDEGQQSRRNVMGEKSQYFFAALDLHLSKGKSAHGALVLATESYGCVFHDAAYDGKENEQSSETHRTHRLKTWPEYFQAMVGDKKKKFELRQNDRDFRVGDILKLEEWDPETSMHTGRFLFRKVTYLIQGGFGLPKDLCIMSVELFAPESPRSKNEVWDSSPQRSAYSPRWKAHQVYKRMLEKKPHFQFKIDQITFGSVFSVAVIGPAIYGDASGTLYYNEETRVAFVLLIDGDETKAVASSG